MESYEKELSRIKNLLRAHPRGLTVTEIARGLRISRNSVAKYLDVLITSGDIDRKAVGPAKVFFSSHRVPISKIMNLTSDSILVLDDQQKIWYVNDRFLVLEGVIREDLIGKPLSEVRLAIFSDPDLRASLDHPPEDRQILRVLTLRRGDSSCFFRVTLVPTTLDGDHRGITIILEDITERLRYEEALKQSEERYRELVEHTNNIILRLDMEGRVIFFNEFAQKFFDYREKEILGKPLIGTVISPTETARENLRSTIHAISASPYRPVREENENTLRNGNRVWIAWTSWGVMDTAGMVTGILCVGNDITDRKIMEVSLYHLTRDLANCIKENSRIERSLS